jgi:hypothetical protein
LTLHRRAVPGEAIFSVAPGWCERLHGGMHELVRSNDIVLLGAIEALLASADLGCLIADQHISALEGMIGAFPRRLLVREQDSKRARALLIEAGYGDELRHEG